MDYLLLQVEWYGILEFNVPLDTVGDFTFWIISVLILEYKIIVNLADEFRSYPVVRIDIRIIRKLN